MMRARCITKLRSKRRPCQRSRLRDRSDRGVVARPWRAGERFVERVAPPARPVPSLRDGFERGAAVRESPSDDVALARGAVDRDRAGGAARVAA